MNNNNGGGIGFCGLLAIVFIVLKLTNVITWSWWLVLLPLWGGFALLLAIFLVFFIIGYFSARRRKPKSKSFMR